MKAPRRPARRSTRPPVAHLPAWLVRLREHRQARQLRQADLAKAMDCSPRTIYLRERGLRGIDVPTLARWTRALGLTAAEVAELLAAVGEA